MFEFKVEFPRKIPKIRNYANVSIIRVQPGWPLDTGSTGYT